MGGKPCIRGTRVTVGTVVGLLAAGHSPEHILVAYPYFEEVHKLFDFQSAYKIN
ncbi:protein of unknown function DUF433 [Geitlerinema sp. FC II]|nr:protein of unknown function DUF433 [Geitlerinema sp. FC II]